MNLWEGFFFKVRFYCLTIIKSSLQIEMKYFKNWPESCWWYRYQTEKRLHFADAQKNWLKQHSQPYIRGCQFDNLGPSIFLPGLNICNRLTSFKQLSLVDIVVNKKGQRSMKTAIKMFLGLRSLESWRSNIGPLFSNKVQWKLQLKTVS